MKRTAFAIVIAATAFLAGCSDEDNARRHLADQGYSNIVLKGTPWFSGCSKDDFYADEFEATSMAGRRVSGVVCAGMGWGKATTIRLY
ncbi:hypothetical protein [Beijerinckia sp. L45]|uniref:hypothetical protein n=1 Tax=Beijerinckia sp. L45 TaxID=1641855 RepID=UPI00131AB872|nr:hypothetical protein [Beijerinckia sp. L45]